MTSNLGAQYLTSAEITANGQFDDGTKTLVLDSIHLFFKPEFINRISAIVVFNPLSRENIRDIIDLRLVEMEERLKDRNIILQLDDGAKDWLAQTGYSPAYGARPLNRVIQTWVKFIPFTFHHVLTVDRYSILSR